MPMNNAERVEHAKDALQGYFCSKGEDFDASEIADYEIADLICDLLHLCDDQGFSHEDALKRALKHYNAENESEK